MRTSKWLSSALLTVAFSVPVNAQTGPSDARVLNSTFRASDMSTNTMEHYAVAEFSVSPEGRLIDGRIIESSGDAAYDERAVRNLGSSLKARPEISADGAVLDEGAQGTGRRGADATHRNGGLSLIQTTAHFADQRRVRGWQKRVVKIRGGVPTETRRDIHERRVDADV